MTEAYKPTKKTLTLTEWWVLLNAKLVDAGQPEAGFKEAREQYEIGNDPDHSALAIQADRNFLADMQEDFEPEDHRDAALERQGYSY